MDGIRFTGGDPKAESYPCLSPYVYCGNNPILNIDPNGEDYWSTNDPEQIRAFLNAVKSKKVNSFQYDNWTHATDKEFLDGLSMTYNDESMTFTSTFPVISPDKEGSGGYSIGIHSFSHTFSNQNGNLNLNYSDKLSFSGWEHLIGPSLYMIFGPTIHKNSSFAKYLWPNSRTAMESSRYTSIPSLLSRRYAPKYNPKNIWHRRLIKSLPKFKFSWRTDWQSYW